jgi:NAD(P)-dependent dehydrogenase (short-subunit alcohol dehydrogenase family)
MTNQYTAVRLAETGKLMPLATRRRQRDVPVSPGLLEIALDPVPHVAEGFARMACFLCSDAGSFITGVAINVDGGASPVVWD